MEIEEGKEKCRVLLEGKESKRRELFCFFFLKERKNGGKSKERRQKPKSGEIPAVTWLVGVLGSACRDVRMLLGTHNPCAKQRKREFSF